MEKCCVKDIVCVKDANFARNKPIGRNGTFGCWCCFVNTQGSATGREISWKDEYLYVEPTRRNIYNIKNEIIKAELKQYKKDAEGWHWCYYEHDDEFNISSGQETVLSGENKNAGKYVIALNNELPELLSYIEFLEKELK